MTYDQLVRSLPIMAILINLATGVLLPNLVALVSTRYATAWFKGLLLLFFSALSGALTQLLTAHTGFEWRAWLLSLAQTYVLAVAAHYGLLKNVTTGSEGAIARRVGGGIGPVRSDGELI